MFKHCDVSSLPLEKSLKTTYLFNNIKIHDNDETFVIRENYLIKKLLHIWVKH